MSTSDAYNKGIIKLDVLSRLLNTMNLEEDLIKLFEVLAGNKFIMNKASAEQRFQDNIKAFDGNKLYFDY